MAQPSLALSEFPPSLKVLWNNSPRKQQFLPEFVYECTSAADTHAIRLHMIVTIDLKKFADLSSSVKAIRRFKSHQNWNLFNNRLPVNIIVLEFQKNIQTISRKSSLNRDILVLLAVTVPWQLYTQSMRSTSIESRGVCVQSRFFLSRRNVVHFMIFSFSQ